MKDIKDLIEEYRKAAILHGEATYEGKNVNDKIKMY